MALAFDVKIRPIMCFIEMETDFGRFNRNGQLRKGDDYLVFSDVVGCAVSELRGCARLRCNHGPTNVREDGQAVNGGVYSRAGNNIISGHESSVSFVKESLCLENTVYQPCGQVMIQ